MVMGNSSINCTNQYFSFFLPCKSIDTLSKQLLTYGNALTGVVRRSLDFHLVAQIAMHGCLRVEVCLGEKVWLCRQRWIAFGLEKAFLPIPCPFLPACTEFSEIVTG